MKKNILVFALMIASIFACQKQETEKKSDEKAEKSAETSTPKEETNPTLITCEGIGRVKFSMSYADLERTFGKENLVTDTTFAGTPMMDGERTTEDRITTTINNIPEGRVFITWAAGKVAKEIEKINTTVGEGQNYTFANGIKIGSTFADFRKANTGGNFEFYGMGWEYGGLIIDETATGDFFKNHPCFTGLFAPKTDNYDKVQKIMGENKFKASQVGNTEANELILASVTLIKKTKK